MQFFKTLSIVSRSSAKPLGNSDVSLRSKRFRLVSEQRNTARKGTFGFDRARNETRAKKWKRGRGKGRKETPSPPPRSFTCATFLAVFDSRSSFSSPKPHRNACYAGYSDLRLAFLSFVKKTIFLIKKLLYTFPSAFKKILKQGGCVQAEKNLCNSSEG